MSLPIRSPRLLAALLLSLAGLAAHATDGEIRKIDSAQGKVTIKHGPITNLDMPAMTMVFKARPATLLQGFSEGDLVSFDADKVEGQYVVTGLRKRP